MPVRPKAPTEAEAEALFDADKHAQQMVANVLVEDARDEAYARAKLVNRAASKYCKDAPDQPLDVRACVSDPVL